MYDSDDLVEFPASMDMLSTVFLLLLSSFFTSCIGSSFFVGVMKSPLDSSCLSLFPSSIPSSVCVPLFFDGFGFTGILF